MPEIKMNQVEQEAVPRNQYSRKVQWDKGFTVNEPRFSSLNLPSARKRNTSLHSMGSIKSIKSLKSMKSMKS